MRETLFLTVAAVGLTLWMFSDVKNELAAFDSGRRSGAEGTPPQVMPQRFFYNDAYMRGWQYGKAESTLTMR